MNRLLFLVCAVAQPLLGQSRNADTLRIIGTEIEELLENVTTEEAESQEADILEHMAESPVDLNIATEADLELIPGVSPMLASSIVARRRSGKFTSIREVLEIDGVSSEEYEIICRYATVEAEQGGLGSPRVRIRTRMQSENPPSDISTPLGPPVKAYTRVLMDTREGTDDGMRLESGLVAEKDGGERYSDFFAAGYLYLQIPRLDGNVLIGDFFVESGKGLMFWKSVGMAKGGDILGIGKPKEARVEPYRSTNENRFFRGMALQKKTGRFSFTGFVSSRWLNGSKNEEGILTSIDSDGLFRTESELKTRHVIRETVLGGMVFTSVVEGFQIGMKASSTRLSGPIALSRYDAFVGRGAEIVAVDMLWKRRMLAASGEVAKDRNGSVAASLGVYLEPTKHFEMVLQARDYPRSFNSLHGSAMSEGGRAEGERGMYVGATLKPSSWLNVSAMYDVYEFSNRFRFPAVGQDFLTKVKIRPDRRWELSVYFRKQNKPALIDSDERGLLHQALGTQAQERYRLSVSYAPSDAVRWQTRIEMSVRSPRMSTTEEGVMVFQEMRWQCYPNLRLSGRIVMFETDTYDTRIYTYEQDVPGGFTNVPLWGSGLRTYILVEISAIQGSVVSVKYSRLFRQSTIMGQDQEAAKDRVTVQWDVSL